MFNKLMNLRVSLLDFTFFAIFACILGVNFSYEVGGIRLSLYRFILVVTLFFFLIPAYIKMVRSGKDKSPLYIQFMFIWILYSCLSGIWAIDHLAWIKYVFFLVSAFLLTILIFSYINDYNSFITAIRIIVILSFCLSILAFYESVTGNYYFLDANSLEWYQNYSLLQKVSYFREPITVFGNPNNYALFLFFSFGFTLFLLIIEKKKVVKLLYSIFLFIIVFLVLIALSRSALMGIGLFLISIIFISLKNGSKAIKYRVLIALCIVSLLGVSFLLKYPYLIDGFFLFDFDAEGSSDSVRSNLIKNGFQILQNTYYFGTGLGNVEAHMSKFRGHDVSNIINLHNMWMEILVSSGVFIFLLFISLFVKNFFQLINKNTLKANPQYFWIKSVFASLSVGFIVSSVGPSSLIGCEWFWPIMALTFKCSSLNES